MSTAAAIRSMLASGLALEQALIAVEAMEQAGVASENFDKRQRRNARYYEANRESLKAKRDAKRLNPTEIKTIETVQDVQDVQDEIKTVQDVSDATASSRTRAVFIGEELDITPLTEPTVPTPQAEIVEPLFGQPKPTRRASKRNDTRETICAELAAVLDRPRAEAVAAYRVSKGAAQTVHAARLLAAEFAKTGKPNEAADLMILNDWRGFRLDWWDRAQNQARAGPNAMNGHGPPRQTDRRMNALKELYHECSYADKENSDEPAEPDASGSGGRIVGRIGVAR